MAFHHLLMGKSVSLRVLSVVGSLEWSTISKCGAISEEKIIALTSIPMNMLHLMMWLKVALACLLVASYYWFMSTSLLTQTLLSRFPHPGFGRRCCPWTYWSSCVSVKKPTGSSFPGVWVYLFVCLYIWTMLSSLFPHFPYLVVLLHSVLQQHWITPLQILSQTSVHFWLMWAFISFQQIELHCAGV